MDILIDSPCTTLCVLATKSCCSRPTQLCSSSPGHSSGRLGAVFVLRLNVPNAFALIPQFTILRYNKERALYNSNFFEFECPPKQTEKFPLKNSKWFPKFGVGLQYSAVPFF